MTDSALDTTDYVRRSFDKWASVFGASLQHTGVERIGDELMVRVDGAAPDKRRYCARILVPRHVGDARWLEWAEPDSDLDYWVRWAVIQNIVETYETTNDRDSLPSHEGILWFLLD